MTRQTKESINTLLRLRDVSGSLFNNVLGLLLAWPGVSAGRCNDAYANSGSGTP